MLSTVHLCETRVSLHNRAHVLFQLSHYADACLEPRYHESKLSIAMVSDALDAPSLGGRCRVAQLVRARAHPTAVGDTINFLQQAARCEVREFHAVIIGVVRVPGSRAERSGVEQSRANQSRIEYSPQRVVAGGKEGTMCYVYVRCFWHALRRTLFWLRSFSKYIAER